MGTHIAARNRHPIYTRRINVKGRTVDLVRTLTVPLKDGSANDAGTSAIYENKGSEYERM